MSRRIRLVAFAHFPEPKNAAWNCASNRSPDDEASRSSRAKAGSAENKSVQASYSKGTPDIGNSQSITETFCERASQNTFSIVKSPCAHSPCSVHFSASAAKVFLTWIPAWTIVGSSYQSGHSFCAAVVCLRVTGTLAAISTQRENSWRRK